MSEATKKALEEFAKQVSWQGAGSPADQDRLADFIITAFKEGDHALTQDDFLDAVNAFDNGKGIEQSEAQKKRAAVYKLYTYQKYEEGIKLLKRFDKYEESY